MIELGASSDTSNDMLFLKVSPLQFEFRLLLNPLDPVIFNEKVSAKNQISRDIPNAENYQLYLYQQLRVEGPSHLNFAVYLSDDRAPTITVR